MYYLLLESLFLLVSIAYYHQAFSLISFNSPPEIGYFKTYYFGFPGNYYSLWGLIDLQFGLSTNLSFFAQRIVSLFLLINSSYLLVHLFSTRMVKNRNLSELIPVTEILISLLLSFNPLFMFIFPIFGFSYFAFMNLSLYFLLRALIGERENIKLAMMILAASFFFSYSVTLYPLILFFSVILYFSLGLPVALVFGRKMRYAIIILSELFIYLLANIFSFLFLLSSVKGVTSLSSSASAVVHVVNLVYYMGGIYATQASSSLYSVSGLNSVFYSSILQTLAILILLLFCVLITYYRRWTRLSLYLTAVFFFVEIINFTYRGKSILYDLIITLVSNHVLRFNHYGIILTVFDGNRAVLLAFWYVITLLMMVVMATSSRRRAKEKSRVMRWIRKIPLRNIAMWSLILVILLILTSAGSPDMSKIMGGSGNYSSYYVNNSPSPDFNQLLLLPDTSQFTSPYVFPTSSVTEPGGNDYPFMNDVLSVEKSPFFPVIDRSFPASTTLINPGSVFLSNENISNVGIYSSLKSFGSSNVIGGVPVFVVGSMETYNSFINAVSKANIFNQSYNVNITPVIGGMQDVAIPQPFITPLNSTILLSITFNVSIKGTSTLFNKGSIDIGIDSNASAMGGYGEANHASVLGLTYGSSEFSSTLSSYSGFEQNGTGWIIVPSFTNSNSWISDATFLERSNDLNLTFKMVEAKISNNYYVFTDIFGKWFSFSAENMFPRQYLTLLEYACRTSNISVSAHVTDYRIENPSSPLLPIFYDSPFPSTSSLINSIKNSGVVIFGNDYNTRDLVFSYLSLNASSSIVLPSAYAIDYPQKGWYQVFSSNDPQGAYYGENINPEELPTETGYGPGIGFAESVLNNSSIVIPLSKKLNSQDIIGMNILFSPMGGPLRVYDGSNEFTIDTFNSNGSYFRWVSLNGTANSSQLKLENVYGVQSVNLIVITTEKSYESTFETINGLLNGKQIFSQEERSQIIGNGIKVYGIFDLNAQSDVIFATGLRDKSTLLLLPTLYPLSYSISASSGSISYVPVWGAFTGLLIDNPTGPNVIVKITNGSYYSGVEIYSPLMLMAAIYIFYSYRKRSKDEDLHTG